MKLDTPLIIAISSRALFDLDESHNIYESDGVEAYRQHQIENEETPLSPGKAFPLVKKLLALSQNNRPIVEVVLVSRNTSDTGLRIYNSIAAHNLRITRASFSGGRPPYHYLTAFGSHLFLSNNEGDVRMALQAGHAAAQMLNTGKGDSNNSEIRIAFDGDAVLFSDESERIFKEKGLEAFEEHEQRSKHKPMEVGPFKGFLEALHQIQNAYTDNLSPIRTALVTARSAPAHERIVHTLRN